MLLSDLDVDADSEPQKHQWKEGLRKEERGWRLSFEWDALQPKRVRFVQPQLFVLVTNDVTLHFVARVFADSFPQPVTLSAVLRIATESQHVTVREVLPDLDSLKARHEQTASTTATTIRSLVWPRSTMG